VEGGLPQHRVSNFNYHPFSKPAPSVALYPLELEIFSAGFRGVRWKEEGKYLQPAFHDPAGDFY